MKFSSFYEFKEGQLPRQLWKYNIVCMFLNRIDCLICPEIGGNHMEVDLYGSEMSATCLVGLYIVCTWYLKL